MNQHTMNDWLRRLSNCLVKPEPAVPACILGAAAERFRSLRAGAVVCIKVSAAHDLPYPFAVSGEFAARVVREIQAANASLNIVLTEGGVGKQSVLSAAAQHGLAALPDVTFIDAESVEPVFVPNPNLSPLSAEGFWLPGHWVEAEARLLLTTCKLRSHHFQRWFSGGTRNLIGLLPRARYQLSSSRRDMRSLLHQRGMDAMVADLYATTGQNVLTILDGRLLARQDEHFPLRFTRAVGQVLIDDDPFLADSRMTSLLRLPFTPPYLELIAEMRTASQMAAPF